MSSRPPDRPARKQRGAGYAVGAFVVEIDQRLLRNLPPVEELVAKGETVRGLAGEPGETASARMTLGGLTVEIPAPLGSRNVSPAKSGQKVASPRGSR